MNMIGYVQWPPGICGMYPRCRVACVLSMYTPSHLPLHIVRRTLRSTTARLTKTSPQNVTLQYHNFFAISPSKSILKINWCERFQRKNRHRKIHIFSKLQICYFHVVMLSTAKICPKMRAARSFFVF